MAGVTVRATLACGHRIEHTEAPDAEQIKARVSWLFCDQCEGRRRVEGVTRQAAPTVAAYEPGTVLQVPGVGYMVASRSTPGAWWLVRQNTCTCPATRRCWHMRQVDAHAAAENKRLARPVAPVNISALVD